MRFVFDIQNQAHTYIYKHAGCLHVYYMDCTKFSCESENVNNEWRLWLEVEADARAASAAVTAGTIQCERNGEKKGTTARQKCNTNYSHYFILAYIFFLSIQFYTEEPAKFWFYFHFRAYFCDILYVYEYIVHSNARTFTFDA